VVIFTPRNNKLNSFLSTAEIADTFARRIYDDSRTRTRTEDRLIVRSGAPDFELALRRLSENFIIKDQSRKNQWLLKNCDKLDRLGQ
jgi:hypothetical protein